MKMSKKGFIGIFAILLVILLVLAGYAYTKTDLFQSPENLFYKYVSQNLELYPKMDYNDMLQNMNDLKEKDYTLTGDMKIKVNGNNYQVQSIKAIEDLQLDYKTVKVKQDSESEINIKYSDKELLKINTKTEENKIGIKIDGIYDKYIAVQNGNLKELFRKLEIETEEIPDKIETIDLYELLYINKEDINKIKQTYQDIIKNSITKEKFTSEKNVETTINNTTAKTNAYKLKLTEKELSEIIKKILETLKNDDLLLNIVESKFEKINPTSSEFSKEELKNEIDKQINEMNSYLNNADEQNYIEIIVYESDGKTLKTEMKIYDDGKEEDKFSIELQREEDKIIAKVSEEENGKKTSAVTIRKTESNSDNSKNLEYEFESDEDGIKSIIAIKYVRSGDNTDISIKFGTDEAEIAIEINEQLEFTSNKELEKMNENNTIILNDKTQEEIAKIFEEVITNAQNLLVEKVQLLGINPSIFSGMNSSPLNGIEENNDAQKYMDLMKKYEDGEITEEQLTKAIDELGL